MRTTMIALTALTLAMPAVAAPAPRWAGVWRNAKDSVHIRTAQCGRSRNSGICGTVIWADARARANVAAAGGRLVGTQLFRNFAQVDDGMWEGEVYVPDLDRTVTGTLTLDGPDTLVGEGCLLGRLGCKTQVWTRVRR